MLQRRPFIEPAARRVRVTETASRTLTNTPKATTVSLDAYPKRGFDSLDIRVSPIGERMKYNGTVSPVLLCLAVGVIAACSRIPAGTPQNAKSSTPSNSFSTMTPQPSESPSTEKEPDSPIRKLDFGNFVFPKLPSGKCSKQKIALVNGRYDAPEDLVPRKIPSVDCWSVALGLINYGDVTGDGEEDAIVTLYAELGGTEGSQDVYIYAFGVRRPKLLWKFATGDRADGGPRRIYAENGKLVIELYGIGTAIGKKLYGTEDVGACCPNHYTRTKYRWIENHFRQDGKEEVLANPSGSSEIVNPPPH